MTMDKKRLRVLVVDDSAHNRRALIDVLSSHPEIEVVGMANDGEKALKAVASLHPDLITLDLEMPRMDGFTFLRVLMAQMPTPVIVISSQSRKEQVFQVLELGALDFIAKPAGLFSADEPAIRDEIIGKILSVRSLQAGPFRHAASKELVTSQTVVAKSKLSTHERVERLVVIGASTGGPPAVQAIIKSVAPLAHSAILVAQHMPEKFTRAFAERLNRGSVLQIREAEEGMAVRAASVYVAPGGCHLQVEVAGGQLVCRVFDRVGADRYAPSIDQLFSSVAQSFSGGLLCVVLTGMGSDGSQGVRAVRRAGGTVLAESAESAIVYGMPKEAMLTGCVDYNLSLDGIIAHIGNFVSAAPASPGGSA